MAPDTAFDRTTSVRRLDRTGELGGDAPAGSALYGAQLDASWASLLGIHGGYVAALAVRCAQALHPDRAVRTVTTSFLRPTSVGEVTLAVDVIRAGRSFTTLHVGMAQDGRLVTTSRITLLRPTPAEEWVRPVADRPAPLAACEPFTPPVSIAHFTQAEFRIDPATIPTGDGSAARVAGHIRPLEPRPRDAAWLVVMGDWFPPSPFRRVQPPRGGISVDYTVHLHRTLPDEAGGWLEGVFASDNNRDGIALEHGVLATADGLPVAETFHTRWTG